MKTKHFFRYNPEKNEYVSGHGNPLIFILTIWSLIVIGSGLSAFFYNFDISSATLEEIAFILLWTGIGIFILYRSLNEFFRKLIINDSGITLKNLIGKKHLSWEDVNDFGITNYRMAKNGKYYYVLYFSNQKAEIDSNKRKRIKGKNIQFLFQYSYYDNVKTDVLEYCKKYVYFEPYITK